MMIDTTAAARRPPGERMREWLQAQRVFISSAMGDTRVERKAVADVVRTEGAQPVWFEEFGRDADPEEAYLSEVDSSQTYVAILNEHYGAQLPSGFSATETEYERARSRGKRVTVFVAASAPGREGHLRRFIDGRVRTFLTTEDYEDANDLARRVKRRLHELAAEALSPWVKLGEYVFRADEIDEDGKTATIHAHVSDEVAHRLEAMRDQPYNRQNIRLAYRNRVIDAVLIGVRSTTRVAGAPELTIDLGQVSLPRSNSYRSGAAGYSPDDLVELGLRSLLFGEALPQSLGGLGSMCDPGIEMDDLRECFDLPNEVAESVTRLVLSDVLVGGGRIARITSFSLGPRIGDRRQIALTWEGPQDYANSELVVKHLSGEWARP